MATQVIQVTISRSQKMTLFASATLQQKQAPLVSQPAWSVDNATIVTLRPSADGSTCDIVATGTTLGVANVTCTAQGQSALTAVVQVTVVTDYADTISITTGNAVPQ